MTLQFFMPMHPPTVTHQAKQLHAYMKGGKPCAVLHDSPQLRDAQAKLHAALAPHCPPEPLRGAVRLVVKWCFPLTGRHHSGDYKTTKPDTDNLQKALKDQMTRLHYWNDDAQVASEVVEKFWSGVPGVFVSVEEIEGIEAYSTEVTPRFTLKGSVPRGKWLEDDYSFYRCSNCGYEWDEPEWLTPYCPKCGAKMEEE